MSARKPLRVLMVCLGNICRSPTAHGVLSALIKRRKLCDYLEVDSAGTGCWHLGEKPDRRSISAAQVRGYDLCALIARQVKIMDFAKFDYILAMDSNNLRDLDKICPNEYKDKLDLLKNSQISQLEKISLHLKLNHILSKLMTLQPPSILLILKIY